MLLAQQINFVVAVVVAVVVVVVVVVFVVAVVDWIQKDRQTDRLTDRQCGFCFYRASAFHFIPIEISLCMFECVKT